MISFKTQTHILLFIVPLILNNFFVLPVFSEIELPEIPKRPTLDELKKSLRNKINYPEQSNKAKEIVLEVENKDNEDNEDKE